MLEFLPQTAAFYNFEKHAGVQQYLGTQMKILGIVLWDGHACINYTYLYIVWVIIPLSIFV